MPVTITRDQVSWQLREEQCFDWLADLGRVFAVFDQQDSGNLCFGVESNGRKLFIKYAGAGTVDYAGDPEDAVLRLRQAVPLYETLRHPDLVNLVSHFETADGYAAVFDWFPGECLHPHWSFPPPAKYQHPDSPFYRYRRLSVEQRLASIDTIFAFHEFVESKGHVAVDFYDGSILYDFVSNQTKICDIDCYRRKPTVNDMGEGLWGSRRFKSPEEYLLGAPLDGRTNVFNLGATAFCLLGGESDRAFAKWDASAELYAVALRAVEPNRSARYASVAGLKCVWDQARERTARG
jgi:serine/threonine-protein kinase